MKKHFKIVACSLAVVAAIALSTFGFSSIASSKTSAIKVGDVDASGAINTADVKLALMCIHFPDVYQLEGEAQGMSLDFDGDGDEDDNDVAFLLMRVEFPDYYELKSQNGFLGDSGEIVLPTIKF